MRKLFKSLVSALLILCLVLTTGITSFAEENESLGQVENLTWKEGSRATAKWDAVSLADYYRVEVKIYFEESLLTTRNTGTAKCEIDLQQELNEARSYLAASGDIQAKFRVKPVILGKNGKEDIEGEWSDYSSELTYRVNEVITLISPDDLAIELKDGRVIASWTHVEHASAYMTSVYFGDRIVGGGHIEEAVDSADMDYYPNYTFENEEKHGKVYSDITPFVETAYIDNSSPDAIVNLSFELYPRVEIHGDTSNPDKMYFKDATEWSNRSNVIEYSSKACKLEEVKNLRFEYDKENDKLIASWDAVDGADYYDVSYKANDEEYTGYAGTGLNAEDYTKNGRVSIEVLNDFLSNIYICRGYADQTVKASFCVEAKYGWANHEGFTHSNISEWSNEVDFNYELQHLLTPTNVYVSEDLYLHWDNYDENSDTYSILMQYYAGNTLSAGRGAYVDVEVVSETSAKAFIGELIKEIYDQYPNPVTVKIQLMAQDNGWQKKPYVSSPYVTAPLFVYNPAGAKTVEKIELSPSDMAVAVGREYYLGKTIYPEDARYIDTVWATTDEDVATVDEAGLVTGMNVGNATVSVSISGVTAQSNIHVYEVETNAQDDDAEEIIEETEDIIEEIVNEDDPDIGNTDIKEEEIEEKKEEIIEAMENGDSFETEIVVEEEDDPEDEAENMEAIEEIAEEEVEYVESYEVEVEMSYTDDNDEKHEIGNITELEKEIEVVIETPEEEEVNEEDYELYRVHEDSKGNKNYDELDFDVNENGSISVKSNKFSTFVLVKKVNKEKPHIHAGIKVNSKNATCESTGVKAYYKCECGLYFTDSACEKQIKDLSYWKKHEGLIKAKGHGKLTSKVTAATTKADGKIVKTCSVCKKKISTTAIKKAYVILDETATYTGKAIKQPVKVVDETGKAISDKYYKITYLNNTKEGKATATVTFTGNYSGKESKKFLIVKKNLIPSTVKNLTATTSKASIELSWKAITKVASGYEIQYSTDKNFITGVKKVSINKAKTAKSTIGKLKSGTTYYVRVRAYGKSGKDKVYSKWAEVKKGIKVK